MIQHGRIVCALNSEMENAFERQFAARAARPKKVLIAGGGIAGMEAAITCADRGHKAILCEKTGQLGGVLRCEDSVPFKKHLREYLDLQVKNIGKRDVKIWLDTAVRKNLPKRSDRTS